jgi:hypothetical protein
MTIQIIDPKPDPSVVKKVLCKHCGVKLSYTPDDVLRSVDADMDVWRRIQCPNCKDYILLGVN